MCFVFIAVFAFEITWKTIYASVGESKRATNRVFKAIHQELAEYWHSNILKRHWARGASQRYGYQERTSAYRKRKRNLFQRGVIARPATDLLLTGRMKENLEQSANIRAYPTRFSVRMYAPADDEGYDYVAMRPVRAGMPNLGEEVTTVSDDEHRKLAAIAEKRLPKLIQQENRRVHRRERIT